MSRLLIVMMAPIKLRYSKWWNKTFSVELNKYFDEVITLGDSIINTWSVGFKQDNPKVFSSTSNSIVLEHVQMQQYLNMKTYNDDILLLCDLSYPGIFANVLYHKPMKNAYAICHGTSKNAYDIFQPTRKSKWKNEIAHSNLFKKVFVATEYHKNKLKWNNTEVVSLPKAPFKTYRCQKRRNIISVSRPCIQKVNKKLEKRVKKDFGTIFRKECKSWKDYYKYISTSKCLLISAKEETFGYQILDAVYNNCIPVAPNKYSYPELLPKNYLYNNYYELENILNDVLKGKLLVPKLKNEKMISNFYKKISEIMLEGV